MLKRLIRMVGGDPTRRDIDRYSSTVEAILALEPRFQELDDAALTGTTTSLRERLTGGEALDDILPEAFAAVREASRRVIGLRHYDVQMIGGMVLHEGRVAEMRTGEGKTLVATLPLYLNALEGKGAHLVTVNDYLARRDARWMGPIYRALGMSVGVLQEAARTDNARKAFLYDPERESTQEDIHQMRLVDRREAYAADILYGTNHEFGFDYLRDNLAIRRAERVQREKHFAIVDEVDNILIDEARTPLIISGPASEDQQEYKRMAQIVRQLREDDYEVNERDRTVVLTEAGESHAEELLATPLRDPDRPEDVTPEQARLIGHLQQALRADRLFQRNRDYLVQGGEVVIVDEFTGRLMHGRRWSDGLHQAVEAKEGLDVQAENVTYATITLQNYFRLYKKLGGMTGTALTEAEEFSKIYKLDVVPIPTNLEYQVRREQTELVEGEYKEEGQRFAFFARKSDPERPVYWRRKDYKDSVYRTEEAKYRAVCVEILRMQALGRPVLVGTTSVDRSEVLSERLRADPLRRVALTLLVRDAWFRKNNIEEDGRLLEELQPLNQKLEDVTPAVLRTISKPLDLSLNPEQAENLARLQELLSLPDECRPRLLQSLQRGIPHQVLNAKKHAEESQIIAGAGAFSAVTIATNMAGRGVDIKLGGEVAEEVLAAVNRVLRRVGVPDPYNLTSADRLRELEKLTPEEVGIFSAEADFFRKHMEEEQRVRSLGGLHVLGSERHEARRIDNQLRGRAARQGDPGSSRFFLSLEDDLMRRFGGDQVSGMMRTMRIDDAVPLESGMVSRLIEQAQTRVEGANFDVRKHLLEYDDVLNQQRAKVYEMRERIFDRDDLSEDVREMIATELDRRLKMAEKDAEGPWKLFGWLEESQPTLRLSEGGPVASYPLQVILGEILTEPKSARAAKLLSLTDAALAEEHDHLSAAFERQVEQIAGRAEAAVREYRDAIDTAMESVEIEAREAGEVMRPQALLDAAAKAVPIDPREVPRELLQPMAQSGLKKHLAGLAEQVAWKRAAAQAAFWLQRRTGLPPEKGDIPDGNFDALIDRIRDQLDAALTDRQKRIHAEVEAQMASADVDLTDEGAMVRLLVELTFRTQTLFDPRTHQRRAVSAARFSWIYLAAKLAGRGGSSRAAVLKEEILHHLLTALESLRGEWGRLTWQRFAEPTLAALPPDWSFAVRQEFEAQAIRPPAEDVPQQDWPAPARTAAARALGGRMLTAAHRDLILNITGQQWVEYLTEMEALRTSIGLEAYAQRDPLVQYKRSAYDLYQELMQQVRSGVVSRLYRMTLRAGPAETQGETPEVAEPEGAAPRKKKHRH